MLKIGGGILVCVILCEALLRVKWGFCDTVLMRASDKYEYIAVPNQNRMRFGNHISYNSLSMRSPEVKKGSIKILGLGDSVINGGVLTDQDSLATTILSNRLSDALSQEVEVLNISAGSWGPDNCNAYLDENGCFDSMAMLLVVSSHDAHDNMDFKPIVGISPSFPERQYPLAIIELCDRYLFPRIRTAFKKRTRQQQLEDFEKIEGIKKTGKGFNTGFLALKYKADSLHIPMIIYLHAELSELGNEQYNSQGKEIINFARLNNIPIIKDLDFGLTPDWYRKGDNIHLSQYGQSKMAELIYPYLLEYCTHRK